ncbi:MAG: hypothetical protein QOF14_4860 [Hyphomicrobiales bacterium]|jgi:hypothetical protein|nr:hypothetical protein [Hyphomicrobiales bacterium]
MSKEIRRLPAKPGQLEINKKQGQLRFEIDKQTEIQGIGMGVLKDGTPFLNQRGLARLCGVENAHIGTISTQWYETDQKPRIKAIKDLLLSRGLTYENPHMVLTVEGKPMFAYPDKVCLAILEYYAFEASNLQQEARKNFRILAGSALQEFIYTQVGYSPTEPIPVSWTQFHDRVSLVFHSVPHGYFSIFKEMSDVIVTLIRGGAKIDDHFIPDISVGQHWAAHWKEAGLELVHGARIQYPHNYPDYFPQSASNPQPAYCYPDSALGEFRRWIREVYLLQRMPSYLQTKARQGALPPSFVTLALQALAPATLPQPVRRVAIARSPGG